MDNNHILVTWIDDDAYTGDAQSEIEVLQNEHLHIEMIGPHKIDDWDNEYTDKADMFLVDYKLSNHSPEGHPVYRFNGVTLSTKLREIAKRPSVPIYLVSRIIESGYQHLRPELVDRCIARKDLPTIGSDLLYNDALDYKKIGKIEKNSKDALASLLEVPNSDRENTLLALPSILRKTGLAPAQENSIENTPGEIVFGRWVVFSLLGNPGVTYDDLYAATYMGMDVDYFRSHVAENLEHENDILKYAGVFSKTTSRYWWKQSLTDHIVSKMPDEMTLTRTWMVAPIVYDVPEDSQTKCFVCGDKNPETVGTDIHDKEVKHPVHIRCSMVDSDSNTSFPFEPVRLMKEE